VKYWRILHLVHQYIPEHIGGVELYTRWLTHALNERGHQASIFYRRSAPGTGVERRTEDGVSVWAAWDGAQTPIRRFMATFGNSAMERYFCQTLDDIRPDVIHIQHLMGHPASLWRVIRQRNIPFVITLWDFWWICANAQLLTNYSQQICAGPRGYLNCARCGLARAGYSWALPTLPMLAGLMAWRNRQLRQVLQAASQIIAPTEFVRGWHAAHGAPTDRLTVIQPGLDSWPQARPTRPTNGPVRFAYIGGLSWQKGVHGLVEAFNGIQEAELWIAGDETADAAYAARLRELAAAGVRFWGKLNREQVWQTLAQVDVVVVPTLWYETFSFIVSEAFAAGAPVIASRLGPLADRVRDGVDGLLVSPGDAQALRNALRQFAQDPALVSRLRASIRPVKTIREHAQEMETVYQGVV
jgi:glycosyltransferase involved in cell wall biosynthesis